MRASGDFLVFNGLCLRMSFCMLMFYRHATLSFPLCQDRCRLKNRKQGAERRRQMGKYREEYKATIVRRIMHQALIRLNIN